MDNKCQKNCVLLVGKVPPPYYGTTVWYDIFMSDGHFGRYDYVLFDSGIHSSMKTIANMGISSVIKNVVKYLSLIRVLIHVRPTLSHVPLSQSQYALFRDMLYVFACYVFRSRVIVHLHGSNLDTVLKRSNPLIQRLFSTMTRKLDGAMVLSERFKYIFQNYGVRKVYVVPNGCDYEKYERKEGGISNSVLFLSNLQDSKGIIDIVKAIRMVRKVKSDVILRFAGAWRDEETKNVVLEIINEDPDGYVYHGVVVGEDKWQLFRDAGVFVFPPREKEGHPWVINEALAHSLPIIATPQGMIPDAVKDDINGYLVPVKSPELIADKLLSLFEDPEKMLTMGKESYNIYMNNYTRDVMVKSFENAIDDVLKGTSLVG